jgi:predicted nucleotidyltransferase
MKTLGIIAEYNPFHNGHLYQLRKAKEITAAEYTIGILSSHFVQRGEPSLIHKWARAKSALLAGMDLVIELPTLFSMSSGSYFAHAAVSILDRLGCVDYLCFGSEDGTLTDLERIAKTVSEENEPFQRQLKSELEKGLSFPKARQNALLKLQPHLLPQTIAGSNNILAIEYLRALKRFRSPIAPFTIKRIANQYHTRTLTGDISSATAIRLNLDDPKVQNAMPDFSFQILQEEIRLGRAPIYSKNYELLLLGFLRTLGKKELENLPYSTEGIHNRIYKAVREATCLEELYARIQTKRYTNTRIQRMLFCALLGITRFDLEAASTYKVPPYARVLGFNQKGEALLKKISKTATIPILTSLKTAKESTDAFSNRVSQIEERACDLYVLGYQNTGFKKAGIDFTHPILKLP